MIIRCWINGEQMSTAGDLKRICWRNLSINATVVLADAAAISPSRTKSTRPVIMRRKLDASSLGVGRTCVASSVARWLDACRDRVTWHTNGRRIYFVSTEATAVGVLTYPDCCRTKPRHSAYPNSSALGHKILICISRPNPCIVPWVRSAVSGSCYAPTRSIL